MTIVAVDAMGGDRAPAEIVAGGLAAAAQLGTGILLVGRRVDLDALLGDSVVPGVEVLHAEEVVGMSDDPAAAVRSKKDSSLVRCAEAVRDGRADAMVSAGNTGAAMASALLRMGRLKGVGRPAVAAPVPVPGSTPTVLVDAGATVDCRPEWLEQFARMGSVYARVRWGLENPRIGLLSNGEEPGKGDELRKQAFERLQSVDGFIGNVEGRDLMSDRVDVAVTDGFTGNVALKAMEGSLRALVGLVFGALDADDEVRRAAEVVMPRLLEAAEPLDPDATGGAMLLGVDGVCVISHGSSSARAILNAVRVASDCVEAQIVDRIKEAIAHAG